MRTIKFFLAALAMAGFVGFLADVRGDEVKVPLDKVPQAVLDGVKKRFPNAELVEAAKETENGKTEFEVSIKDGGTKMDIMLTPEGAITLIEKEIAAADLPKVVKAALDKKYPGATYKVVEEVTKVEAGRETLAYYEAHLVTAGNKKVEVEVNPDGTLRGK